MPKISVIVPVYNVQPYLRACMGSLVGQTFCDIEIICVDDGSTDASSGILAEYAGADARVRVLTQPNRGESAARNAGLAVATAPLIMFCDSDDRYALTMCEEMYAAMQGSADMAVCGVQGVTETGKLRTWRSFDLPTEGEVAANDDMLMFNNNVCVWNKIYRRNLLEHGQIRFPEGLCFEDEYFTAVYTASVRRIAFVPDKLYFYCRRPDSLTGRIADGGAEYTEDCVHIANQIWLYHEEHGLVARRLPYLAHTWLKLCSAALSLSRTPEESEDREDAMISFAETHIIPCNGLPPTARQRLKLLVTHRWVGLHKHAGGHIVSRCKERVTPKGCKLKIVYYLMDIPFWMCRVMLPTTENERIGSRVFGSSVKTRDSATKRKVYMLGMRVYSIKYFENCAVHRILGLPIYRESRSLRVNLALSTANFHPFTLDDHVLLTKLRGLGHFVYIPNPGNMGDMLIAAATFRFFEKHQLPYIRFAGRGTADAIVYGGGGTWVSDCKLGRKKFLPYFARAKKILVLPSSFHDCPRFVQQLDSRFTVFCRDRRSYEYLKRANSDAEILLDHDMAFRVDTSVFCFRNEVFGDSVRRIIARVFAARQLVGTVGHFLRRDRETIYSHLPSDMDVSSYAFGTENMSEEFAKQCAAIMLSVVDSVDAVVTDRLHVAIAAVLMGKEVYLMDNNYGKLSAVFENSLSGIPGVHFVKEVPKHLNPIHTVSGNLSQLFHAT